MMHVVRCMLSASCIHCVPTHVVRCMLPAARCLLHVLRCMLSALYNHTLCTIRCMSNPHVCTHGVNRTCSQHVGISVTQSVSMVWMREGSRGNTSYLQRCSVASLNCCTVAELLRRCIVALRKCCTFATLRCGIVSPSHRCAPRWCGGSRCRNSRTACTSNSPPLRRQEVGATDQ